MKKKRRVKVWPIITIIVVVLLGIIGFCMKDILKLLKNNQQSQVTILSEIPAYGYSMNENDSEYYKSLFKDLKKLLEGDDIEDEAYACLVSQLFITDLYSLNSAINKNDIGGTQFVWHDFRNDFEKIAKTSLYAYVENNMYGTRKQELPSITNAEVTEIKKGKINFQNNDVEDENGYTVKVTVTYEKDLGYPTEFELLLLHNQEKIEVGQLKVDET